MFQSPGYRTSYFSTFTTTTTTTSTTCIITITTSIISTLITFVTTAVAQRIRCKDRRCPLIQLKPSDLHILLNRKRSIVAQHDRATTTNYLNTSSTIITDTVILI